MAEEDQDKTEEATPYKLREAIKRGQVSKSMEVNSFLILLAVLLLSYMTGYKVFNSLLHINANILSMAGQLVFSESPVMMLYKSVIDSVVSIFSMIMVTVIIIGVLANILQVGPIFTIHPVKPDLQRLNPVSGFKRVFSMKMMFEFIKSVIKIILFTMVVYFAMMSVLPDLIGLLGVSYKSYGYLLFEHANSLLAKLLAALFFVAIVDFAFNKRDFSKKMMMSRRELKDEVRRREGDPRIKSKQRELQHEASRRGSSISKVSDADVLITNPTHLAVAISYKRDEMSAPMVLAKGAGDLAAKMKVVARKHNIPIFEDKPLARELFRNTGIEQVIPEELFKSVAKLLVISYRIKKQSGLRA